MFNSLDKGHIHQIIELEIADLFKRVEALNYKLVLSEEAMDFIADKGYDPQFGARPLKRAIQKYLEDEMAEIIIKSSVAVGDTIYVELDKENDKLLFKFSSHHKH